MPTSRKLVEISEQNADELTRQWLQRVRSDPNTSTYRGFDEKELYDRAYDVFHRLGKWISHETTKQEIEAVYTALGRERRREGFALAEVILALIFSRQILWDRIQNEGLLDNALDLHNALELRNRVAQFFDRATYFVIVGYDRERAAG
ncbi:MAG: RsbRD N-terminal domain-containing protein [Planctomycetes bacterium]|nr:RsbRD N-terminal domain-containing protein [Planctomycetota bacterium]